VVRGLNTLNVSVVCDPPHGGEAHTDLLCDVAFFHYFNNYLLYNIHSYIIHIKKFLK
jgi:hypothetical protein